MNKKDYLDLLRYYLRDLPQLVVDDIVYDYEEHFNMGMEKGRTEYQISEELGSPDDIAKEYLGRDPHKTKKKMYMEEEYSETRDKTSSNSVKNLVILILLIIFAPAIFGLILGLFGLIFGLFMVFLWAGIGLIGGAIGLIGSLFVNVEPYINLPGAYSLSPITKILSAVSLGGFGILSIIGGIEFLKWSGRIIKDLYISLRWKMER